MEGLWWLILIVLFLLFGNKLNLSGVSLFNQPNAVPTPNGIPASTTQNNTNPPSAQPPVWARQCGSAPVNPVTSPVIPTPVSPSLPMVGNITVSNVKRPTLYALAK